ncbi:MAG: tRNA (adenosine(37)-N6)-dimethylallyltransferase MiaA [Coriobacteriales bacterium]|nr:tRNA (adenosine(37)-N6)-dimethylallyltransferase MiaA [Coriobacteriales bacterium]
MINVDKTSQPEIIAIIGPTASGKSLLADRLAQRIGGEVISADSMQVYRGMDIGTAKIPLDERSVPYHGIDLVDPGETFTAALYQRYARAAISEIHTRGQRVVFCGGTGLYLRAALDDFDLDEGREDESGITSASLRERLNKQAEELGAEAFHALLASSDPESAGLIHPNNTRRLIRAFELLEQGSSYAESSAGFSRFESAYPLRLIGLSLERELLYGLIDARVDAMLADGLLGEVQVLLSEGFSEALTAMQAIGYKELVPVLAGECPLGEAVDAIKQATRHYAKRQLTWFGRDPRVEWLDISDLHSAHQAGRIDVGDFARLLLSRALTLLQ